MPVVEDAWQIVVHGSAPSGQDWENVFGWVALDDDLTQAAADAISQQLADAYDTLDGWSDEYTVDSITVTDLRTLDGPQFDSVEGMPITGTDEAHPLPLQTAALISWGTSRRGKSFRGRTYLPGFTETFADGAHITGDALNSVTEFRDALLDPAFKLGIISRFSGVDEDTGEPIPRDPGIITAVSSGVVHTLWKTQRRRAPKG